MELFAKKYWNGNERQFWDLIVLYDHLQKIGYISAF